MAGALERAVAAAAGGARGEGEGEGRAAAPFWQAGLGTEQRGKQITENTARSPRRPITEEL